MKNVKSKPPKSSFRFSCLSTVLVFFIIIGALGVFWAVTQEPAPKSTTNQDGNLTVRPTIPELGPPPPNIDATMPELPASPHSGLRVLANKKLIKNYDFGDEQYDALVQISASDITLDCGGHHLSGSAGYGLVIENVSNVTIENCHFTCPFQGILASNAKKISIINSTFTSETNGMHAFRCDEMFLDGLAFQAKTEPSKGFAVEIKESKKVTFRRSQIYGFQQGLLFYGTDDFIAKDNRIERITETGIGTFKMDRERIPTNGVIEKNWISKCMMGLEIHAGSKDIKIEKNQVSHCKMSVRIDDAYSTPQFAPIKNIRLLNNIFENNRDGSEILVMDKEEVVIED